MWACSYCKVFFFCLGVTPITLYSVSHEPFFQNMVLIIYMPILYPFALKIKYYTPSHGNRSMFYNLPWQFDRMNTSLNSSTDIYHYMVTFFVSNGTLSCLPCFVKFASTFSIITFCLPEVCCWMNMAIFRLPFIYRLTLRRILRKSNQLHQVTLLVKTDWKVQVVSFIIQE
jgi:hypothetical protein